MRHFHLPHKFGCTIFIYRQDGDAINGRLYNLIIIYTTMPEKFLDKYRIPSARAQWWNYGNNGSYFVTICTKNREHSFGEIIDDEMQLSEIGKLAYKYWYHIPVQFSYVLLDEFVVMPNHIHGIITIDKKPDNDSNPDAAIMETPATHLSPSLSAGSGKTGGFAGIKNPMLTDNLSRVINWYKGRVKFNVRSATKFCADKPGFMTVL
ncbi:MAG: hypothetical protein V4722_11730 [Bacteroidota bacterium]